MGKYLFSVNTYFSPELLDIVEENKSFSLTLLVPATHNQPSALDLLITKLCFSNSHLLREKNYKPLNVWRCWDVHRGAHMSHFVRASGEGLPVSEDTGGEACIEVEKEWGRKERMGLNPPTSKLFPPAVSCDIYLLRWFCQKPSGLAMPPHSLICCLVLSRLSSEKEGVKGSAKDTPRGKNMAHRVHLDTPHTIPYTLTHTNITPDDAQEGWGVGGHQALIIIKGPMICFLLHWEEHGSHLNEYQINTLKLLQHSPDCCVQSMHCNKQKPKIWWRLRDFSFVNIGDHEHRYCLRVHFSY